LAILTLRLGKRIAYNASVCRERGHHDEPSQSPGANFEITVDGKSRTYRDDLTIAIEAAKYLKSKNPNVEVAIRDIRTNVVTPIQWISELPSSPDGRRPKLILL